MGQKGKRKRCNFANQFKSMRMKKLLLFISASFLIVNLFSQNLTLSDANGTVDPSVIYHVLGDPTQIDPLKASIYVTNNSSAAMDVGCKKVIAEGDTLTGTSNYFCWGACYPNWVYVSPQNVTIDPGQTTQEFYGDYEPKGVAGKSYITYVWFDANNPNDSISIEVEFNASPAGIVNPAYGKTGSRAYPNPANDNFTFEYVLSGSGTFVLSNILGAKIREIKLDDASGKISVNTGELSEGVYFYSVLENGRLVETNKLVIRH